LNFNHIHHDFKELIQDNSNGSRAYITPEGHRYPSVTTVLSEHSREGIEKWKKRVGEVEANKISNRASNRGTSIHTICEQYLLNNPVDKTPYPLLNLGFKSLKTHLNRLNNIRCLETRLYSDILKLAGTVDCVAEYDGVLSIIDFKTSNKPKKLEYVTGYFMQGTAYSIMFEERTGIAVDQVVIMVAVDYDNPQVFVVNSKEHQEHLQKYVDLYWSKQSCLETPLS